jgi:Flp pilus assembly protein TadG
MSLIHRALLDHPEQRRGQAMVIFALIFVVLVGFAGLSLDATHLYLVQHTAQNAVDAAALAAGKRLAGATQGSPPPDSNDLSAIAAHDFAAADGFITTRSTACDRTIISGTNAQFTTTWYDKAGLACGTTSGFNNAVSIAVPPYILTPHCQASPYNCMQIIVQSRVQNYLMGSLGIPTSLVQASATVYAQPSGTFYDVPAPLALYLYEKAGLSCSAGYQCFNRTKAPTRSNLNCSPTDNCPTFWVQPGADMVVVGVDGTSLNPPADTVAMESNGDMVLGGSGTFCDINGIPITSCSRWSATGAKGFAIAPGATLYCTGGAGTKLPTPCTPAGPGGYGLGQVIGNETNFLPHDTWTPRVNLTGLPNCGTVVLNGGTVANSGSTCPPPASEPYNLLPGIYNSIVVNHGAYTFEPGVYDILGVAHVNDLNGMGQYADGIDHSYETASSDWDLCNNTTLSPTACPSLTAGVWIGHGQLSYVNAGTTTYGTCGGAATVLGGGGDPTSITAHGVTFRFESGSAGFVSTSEVTYIAMTSPGLGQERRVNGAPLLFDMENNHFIHIDASGTRDSEDRKTNTFSGTIYQQLSATAGGVELNPGRPSRRDGEDGGVSNNPVVGQIIAYSYTAFGQAGAMDYSNGTGGAATPTVTTSGNQENQILSSSKLVAGPTPTTESLVVAYTDEWALDAYDAYVKINSNSPVYFSDGIWNPRPILGATLPPNGVGQVPSDTNPAAPTGAEAGQGNYTRTSTGVASKWTMNYPVGSSFGNHDGSTFTIDGNWIWGHERDLTTSVRANDLATLTYTFPVPTGTTVTISMFMTDGDRCGDYVTAAWTFNNIGTPAPGVQVIGSVRLEQ